MEINLLVVGSMAVAVLLTWLLMQASHRWGRGRGLLRVPERVERENVERLLNARAERAQGWREMWWTALRFLSVGCDRRSAGFLLGATIGLKW